MSYERFIKLIDKTFYYSIICVQFFVNSFLNRFFFFRFDVAPSLKKKKLFSPIQIALANSSIRNFAYFGFHGKAPASKRYDITYVCIILEYFDKSNYTRSN